MKKNHDYDFILFLCFLIKLKEKYISRSLKLQVLTACRDIAAAVLASSKNSQKLFKL